MCITLPITRIRIPCPPHYCYVICKPHGLQLSLIVHGHYMETLPITHIRILCPPHLLLLYVNHMGYSCHL